MTSSDLKFDKPVVPSLAAGGPDAVTMLTAYLVLLFAVPSRFVVSGLGGAGTPANLIAVGCALWWIWEMARRRDSLGVSGNPVRTCAALFFMAVIISYWVAATRPINSAERSSADLGLILVVSWMGVLLLAHDGIPNLERWNTIVRRMAAGGGILALLGVVQFVTGSPLTDRISIPGLVANLPLDSLSTRDGFNRPASTALHAIEFSVVTTMLLPLAVVLALQNYERSTWRRWGPVLTMAVVVPMTISRSAMVGAVVGFIVLTPALPRRARGWLIMAAGVGAVGVFLLIPGMLGSLLQLFTGVSTDSSALSRTGSYELVWEYFLHRPLIGRGLFTFLPAHRILDNQYLGLLLDIGLVGLVMTLALLTAGMLVARRSRRLSADPNVRALAQALVAAIAVGTVGLALFDGLGFPMAAGILFLCLGLAGGLWRLVRMDARSSSNP